MADSIPAPLCSALPNLLVPEETLPCFEFLTTDNGPGQIKNQLVKRWGCQHCPIPLSGAPQEEEKLHLKVDSDDRVLTGHEEKASEIFSFYEKLLGS
jgi:hypothetical protein